MARLAARPHPARSAFARRMKSCEQRRRGSQQCCRRQMRQGPRGPRQLRWQAGATFLFGSRLPACRRLRHSLQPTSSSTCSSSGSSSRPAAPAGRTTVCSGWAAPSQAAARLLGAMAPSSRQLRCGQWRLRPWQSCRAPAHSRCQLLRPRRGQLSRRSRRGGRCMRRCTCSIATCRPLPPLCSWSTSLPMVRPQGSRPRACVDGRDRWAQRGVAFPSLGRRSLCAAREQARRAPSLPFPSA